MTTQPAAFPKLIAPSDTTAAPASAGRAAGRPRSIVLVVLGDTVTVEASSDSGCASGTWCRPLPIGAAAT